MKKRFIIFGAAGLGIIVVVILLFVVFGNRSLVGAWEYTSSSDHIRIEFLSDGRGTVTNRWISSWDGRWNEERRNFTWHADGNVVAIRGGGIGGISEFRISGSRLRFYHPELDWIDYTLRRAR
ncbi:MAG: hypothetical protein FWC69_03460 [Defluviitaleaceae bacterium]|nr:hypothetical protein [Defluviitaleaceae bacterium]